MNPPAGISTLSQWWGFRAYMNLRAMPAVTYVTSRAFHAGRVKGDRPDQKRYPGPPGWGLGHETDNITPVKNINC
jgi:hypothetical protein